MREVDFISKLIKYGPVLTRHLLTSKIDQLLRIFRSEMSQPDCDTSKIDLCSIAIETLVLLNESIAYTYDRLDRLGGDEIRKFDQLILDQYENILSVLCEQSDYHDDHYLKPNNLLANLSYKTAETIKNQALNLINQYKADVALILSCENLTPNCDLTVLASIVIVKLDSLHHEMSNITIPDETTRYEFKHSMYFALQLSINRLNFILNLLFL